MRAGLRAIALMAGAGLVAGCSRPFVTPTSSTSPPAIDLSERLETDHLIFHYSPGDFIDVQRNEAYCRWASSFLGVELPQKINYYKWKDREQEWRVSEETVVGLAGGFTVMTNMPWMNHELFHIYSLRLGTPTIFFLEGIAVAYQVDPSVNDFEAREKSGEPLHDLVKRMKVQGRLLPFDSIITSTGFVSNDYTIAYDEAGSFVRYVADTYGIEQMKQVFRTIGYGDSAASVATKFQSIYGMTLADADNEWRAFLDRRTREREARMAQSAR